jgi:hypothetical protein
MNKIIKKPICSSALARRLWVQVTRVTRYSSCSPAKFSPWALDFDGDRKGVEQGRRKGGTLSICWGGGIAHCRAEERRTGRARRCHICRIRWPRRRRCRASCYDTGRVHRASCFEASLEEGRRWPGDTVVERWVGEHVWISLLSCWEEKKTRFK